MNLRKRGQIKMSDNKQDINLSELSDVSGGYIMKDANVWRVINRDGKTIGGEFRDKKQAENFAKSINLSSQEIGAIRLNEIRERITRMTEGRTRPQDR